MDETKSTPRSPDLDAIFDAVTRGSPDTPRDADDDSEPREMDILTSILSARPDPRERTNSMDMASGSSDGDGAHPERRSLLGNNNASGPAAEAARDPTDTSWLQESPTKRRCSPAAKKFALVTSIFAVALSVTVIAILAWDFSKVKGMNAVPKSLSLFADACGDGVTSFRADIVLEMHNPSPLPIDAQAAITLVDSTGAVPLSFPLPRMRLPKGVGDMTFSTQMTVGDEAAMARLMAALLGNQESVLTMRVDASVSSPMFFGHHFGQSVDRPFNINAPPAPGATPSPPTSARVSSVRVAALDTTGDITAAVTLELSNLPAPNGTQMSITLPAVAVDLCTEEGVPLVTVSLPAGGLASGDNALAPEVAVLRSGVGATADTVNSLLAGQALSLFVTGSASGNTSCLVQRVINQVRYPVNISLSALASGNSSSTGSPTIDALSLASSALNAFSVSANVSMPFDVAVEAVVPPLAASVSLELAHFGENDVTIIAPPTTFIINSGATAIGPRGTPGATNLSAALNDVAITVGNLTALREAGLRLMDTHSGAVEVSVNGQVLNDGSTLGMLLSNLSLSLTFNVSMDSASPSVSSDSAPSTPLVSVQSTTVDFTQSVLHATSHVVLGRPIPFALSLPGLTLAMDDCELSPSCALHLAEIDVAPLVVACDDGQLDVDVSLTVVAPQEVADKLATVIHGGRFPMKVHLSPSTPPSIVAGLLADFEYDMEIGESSHLFILHSLSIDEVDATAVHLSLALTIPNHDVYPTGVFPALSIDLSNPLDNVLHSWGTLSTSPMTIVPDEVLTLEIAIAPNVPLIASVLTEALNEDLPNVLGVTASTSDPTPNFIESVLVYFNTNFSAPTSGGSGGSFLNSITNEGSDGLNGLILHLNAEIGHLPLNLSGVLPGGTLHVNVSCTDAPTTARVLSVASAPIVVDGANPLLTVQITVQPDGYDPVINALQCVALSNETIITLYGDTQQNDNVLGRVLSAWDYSYYFKGPLLGGNSIPVNGSILSAADITIMSSTTDSITASLAFTVNLPTNLPPIVVGGVQLDVIGSGVVIGTAEFVNLVIVPGNNSLLLVVALSAANRPALENFISQHLLLQPLPVTLNGTILPLNGLMPITMTYSFTLPAQSGSGGSPTSIVECAQMTDLDVTGWYLDECGFTSTINAYMGNPAPFDITLQSMSFDMTFDNPNGVCVPHIGCLYDPVMNYPFGSVSSPGSTPIANQLPQTLSAHQVTLAALQVAAGGQNNELCMRLGDEYLIHDQVVIHILNGVVTAQVENFVITLQFVVPNYVVTRNSQSCLQQLHLSGY